LEGPLTDWDEHEPDDEETDYAQRRVNFRTYATKSFELLRTNSTDDGTQARFIRKVFDPDTETSLEPVIDGWVVRESPAGRYQIKVLVAREPGNVKELWIQRVPAPGTAGSIKTLLNLKQPDIARLFDYLKIIEAFPVEGSTTVRLDDSIIHELLSDPDSLAQVYRRAPDRVRDLIASDGTARDVLALEARRQQLERFRNLLDDDEFFDSEVAATARKRPEDVWQQLFEANPWMLGVSLTGQLLTSWSDERLEQVVSGTSIATTGKRIDALLRTAGRIRSMVFTEIKTHRTPLLGGDDYRSGC
jgi:antiviral defense system Shedu protein SduA